MWLTEDGNRIRNRKVPWCTAAHRPATRTRAFPGATCPNTVIVRTLTVVPSVGASRERVTFRGPVVPAAQEATAMATNANGTAPKHFRKKDKATLTPEIGSPAGILDARRSV